MTLLHVLSQRCAFIQDNYVWRVHTGKKQWHECLQNMYFNAIARQKNANMNSTMFSLCVVRSILWSIMRLMFAFLEHYSPRGLIAGLTNEHQCRKSSQTTKLETISWHSLAASAQIQHYKLCYCNTVWKPTQCIRSRQRFYRCTSCSFSSSDVSVVLLVSKPGKAVLG